MSARRPIKRLLLAVAAAATLAGSALGQVPPGFEQTFSHQGAQANGVRLHYVIGGRGPVVVLLHGHPQSWYQWRRIMPALARAGRTVIAVDMRGFGDSERPQSGFDKRTVAEDIHQLVRGLGHERVSLVGHDLGGMVAYAYAAAYPGEVERLVLMEHLFPGFDLEPAMDVANGGYWHLGFYQTPDMPEMLIRGREREYFGDSIRFGFYDPANITEADIDEYVRGMKAPGGLRATFGYYRALKADAAFNRQAAQTPLAMPLLTVGGEWGLKDNLARIAPRIAANHRSVVIERCGHNLAEDCPDALLGHLLPFLTGGVR